MSEWWNKEIESNFEEFIEGLEAVARNLGISQIDLDPKISKIVDEHFWELADGDK